MTHLVWAGCASWLSAYPQCPSAVTQICGGAGAVIANDTLARSMVRASPDRGRSIGAKNAISGSGYGSAG